METALNMPDEDESRQFSHDCMYGTRQRRENKSGLCVPERPTAMTLTLCLHPNMDLKTNI